MRIKKIYLKNFKGIKEKRILDFESKSALLVGPNGFGKTTIYDVFELCLTGRIHRTEVNNGVTIDNKDYEKPFFQNKKGEDVIVKMWLENENEDLIIVRYLSKDNTGRSSSKGRRNKPCDFKLLKLYKDIASDFEHDRFTPDQDKALSDSEINRFLALNSEGESICNLYHLFNYVQQEETTYFLKKSENDRKSALGFLFQTSEAEKELDKITSRLSKLEGIRTKLNDRINTMIQATNIDDCKYERVFSSKSIHFDDEHPFEEHTLDKSVVVKDKFSREIRQLIDFKATFDPREYEKKKKAIALEGLINDDFLSFYMLQSLLEDNTLDKIKKEFQLLDDTVNQKVYVLQKLVPELEKLKSRNVVYDKYSEFNELKVYEEQLAYSIKLSRELMPDKSKGLEEKVKLRSTIKSVVGTVEGSINEIIQLRSRISNEMDKIYEQSDDNNCPYCGYPWGSIEELEFNFQLKEKRFNELLNEQSKKLKELDEELQNDYLYPIQTTIKTYLENNSKVDIQLIKELEAVKDQGVSPILVTLLNDREDIWQEPRPYDDIAKALESIQKKMNDSVKLNKEAYTLLIKLENIDFTESIRVLKEYNLYGALNELRLDGAKKQITLNHINRSIERAKGKILELKKSYLYIHEKAIDENGLYSKFFDENSEFFDKVDVSILKRKQSYINFEMSQKQSNVLTLLKKRVIKLDNAIEKLSGIKEIYSTSITEYKKDMVERIKVPFYIYSAKILQNYQQGMGVFLSTKENSDSIRFLTDPSSDHDAMHHLSSGQLAVISLAFTLAINKTYNISKELKFLLIDDPIQEMDSLNIHSFIEIIRHDFIKDYQLIFSTHNDTDALYIKYQIEKITEDDITMTNVQSLFFG